MGNIAKIMGRYDLGDPGWDPKKEQFDLPFTVELKEDFHIHWQDVRIEMTSEDFEKFVEAIAKAYDRWKEDGKPKRLRVMKRYGWWPGEEGFEFWKDRYEKYNKNNEVCHNFRTFPRTQHGKVYQDHIFQIEFQVGGQYHIHYKNFRLELGKERFNKMAELMISSVEKEEKYGKVYHLIGTVRIKYLIGVIKSSLRKILKRH